MADKAIARGLELIKRSRVAICGLARNNEERLPIYIRKVEELMDLCHRANVFIYENDSTDATKRILVDWMHDNDDVLVKPTNPGLESFGSVATLKRAKHMCDCRNKYLDMIRSSGQKYDFIIPIDVDLQDWPIEGILHSLGQSVDWNCISANGKDSFIDKNNKKQIIYYDNWSLVSIQSDLPRHTVRIAWPNNHPLIRVKSGFGGIAVYKAKEMLECYYHPKHYSGVYGSEHVGLHAVMWDKGYNQHFVNPAMEVIR
jgi:hypothetical protein